MITTTSTTVTLTWSPPDIVPQTHYTNCKCHRLCEQSNDVNIFTFPYISQVVLIGDYDISELIGLVAISATTLSTGNNQYLIQSFSISIYSSYFN